MAKYRITLTDNEISTLWHIMYHFTDYMAGDNRPDHGLAVLRKYRKVGDERKREIYILAGRLGRAHYRIQKNKGKGI